MLQVPARASQRMGFDVKRAEVEEDVESVRHGRRAVRAAYRVIALLCWRCCLSLQLPQIMGAQRLLGTSCSCHYHSVKAHCCRLPLKAFKALSGGKASMACTLCIW